VNTAMITVIQSRDGRWTIGTMLEKQIHRASRLAHTMRLHPTTQRSGMIQVNIERALGRLSRQERSVFVLRHYHDLPLKEIAVTLSLAEGTVKSYLFRALRRLQHELAFYRNDFEMER